MKRGRVEKVEKALGVELPRDYADFLEREGIGQRGETEIYGYREDVTDLGKIPCVVGATRLYGATRELPPRFLVVAHTGFEDVVAVLDAETGKVHEAGREGMREVAASFGEWLRGLEGGG